MVRDPGGTGGEEFAGLTKHELNSLALSATTLSLTPKLDRTTRDWSVFAATSLFRTFSFGLNATRSDLRNGLIRPSGAGTAVVVDPYRPRR